MFKLSDHMDRLVDCFESWKSFWDDPRLPTVNVGIQMA